MRSILSFHHASRLPLPPALGFRFIFVTAFGSLKSTGETGLPLLGVCFIVRFAAAISISACFLTGSSTQDGSGFLSNEEAALVCGYFWSVGVNSLAALSEGASA